MKDKIKEMIDCISYMSEEERKRQLELSDIYEFGTAYAYYLLEENKRLKEQCKKWKENHKAVCIQRDDMLDNIVEDIENKINYKSRNEKAIEYIKRYPIMFDSNNDIIVGYCLGDNDALELLNILQGSDKE